MRSRIQSPEKEAKKADHILRELAIEDPNEIEVEVIAEYLGATIKYKPLNGCEARIVGYGDRAIIVVNSTSSRGRQRFSAGHELGHWVNDRGKVAFACESAKMTRDWSENDPESRANRFSTNLLLPLSMFVPRAEKKPPILDTIRELASTFETSLTATAIRLVEHGSYPAMVVCNSPDRRIWFCRSPDLPRELWPLDRPGRHTLAHEFLASGASVAVDGSIDVYADEWISLEGSDAYSIHEESLVVAGGLVLSVLWWKDEKQLIDLDEALERRASRRSDGRDEW
jgi:Zn-dependent peptidase ImmA (M78 family)